MARNNLGELRRSAALMTFGPGSVVDFRADDGSVSTVAAGLEEWDRRFPPAGLTNPQRIREPRLQRKLGVRGFRLPPVVDELWCDQNGEPDKRTLVAARFPRWLQCPKCDRIAPARKWASDPGRSSKYCAACTRKAPGRRKVRTVPTRFVMACEKGHLDEFPWHFWVGHKADCGKKEKADLYLRSERPGLAGLILRCDDCNAWRSMDGVFAKRVWREVRCRGRRPWLASGDESCARAPRALQRGAANLYFPFIDSALSIPPWSDPIQEALGDYWDSIVNVPSEQRPIFIGILAKNDLEPALRELGLGPDQLASEVEERVRQYNDERILNIREEEYRQLASGVDTPATDAREFEIRNVHLPESLSPYFSRLVRVVRLREVRALRGFTRINPPGDEESPDIAPISVAELDWLPAVEIRGEGVFLTLRPETLHHWEAQPAVVKRAAKIHHAWRAEWRKRYGSEEPPLWVTPRFLLIHAFAHALMRQLTLESGYSSASLRERLYASDGVHGMAGLLVYTATSDSDGTLGGLQRQGEADRIERAVEASIRAMEWCSSDPLCIEGMISPADGLSLAACHACMLAPETACEEYNRFLDRAVLVGLPGAPEVGFFSGLIKGV